LRFFVAFFATFFTVFRFFAAMVVGIKIWYVDPSLHERIHTQTFLIDIIARKKILREQKK